LIGGGSIVAAGRDGTVSVLLEVPRVEVVNTGQRSIRLGDVTVGERQKAVVPDDEVGRRLASRSDVELRSAPSLWRVVRELPPLPAPPTCIVPAHRRRGFLVGAEDSTVALYYSTSGRRLLMDRWGEGAIGTVAMAPKGDGALAVAGGSLLWRGINNPHPEVSLRTLFMPVWYEGYARPKWVWQSTGGSDAFEPKMSLWPLVFGTLKATLYAMFFSVPLALMAAVYVSQLAPTWLQTAVKPTVELMAAVPSVVVGFLAALWLAPRLEATLFAVFLAMVAMPLAVAGALAVWRMAPLSLRRWLPEGSELVVLLGAGAAGIGMVALVSGPLEGWLFGGDLQRFLFTELGLRYDQRNSMVVGIALGFAVIPVIFTIAEDACSAVPQSLVSASRALGATRWQTAVRLVVPAASPGLFAAVMLGLGRAVGETMIVLMAAGNTPLLDLSPFNGMRTMSAAIAVEIPEAPVGSTLFRVLFLTGTLLFVFTLVLTTAADTVGSYLRKRYARF
jgi:phosphate transport system permease protein